MKTTNIKYHLRKLMQQLLVLRIGEIVCWSVGVTAFAYAILHLTGMSSAVQIAVVIVIFTAAFVVQWFSRNLHKLNFAAIARYLDATYPSLENSTDLLLVEPTTLHGLQKFQYEKINGSLDSLYRSVRFPNKVGRALTFCLVSLAACVLVVHLQAPVSPAHASASSGEVATASVSLPAGIESVEVAVDPPRYTNIPGRVVNEPNLSIPEGSTVTWRIGFTRNVKDAGIVSPNADTMRLRPGIKMSASKALSASSYYRIFWVTDQDSLITSDYYAIEVIPDRPPKIETVDLKQFNEIEFGGTPKIPVSAILQDDYGLTESYLVATVAKGSGESVKFREEKLRFDTPDNIKGKTIRASRALNLTQLGLDPGDELYFYVIAFDNRVPERNYARTETYFVTIKDTARIEGAFDGSLGVDLMPEYFRSQRQIIIDSEKLIKEKSSISKKEFASRSNELAHDQKILRLRYGQFLGEEFETGIVHEDTEHEHDDHDQDDDDDVAKKFGHVHDSENEHNLVPDKHHHADDENETKDPFDAFVHRHDDPEEATFFTQSIRAKLKATLTIMWDAELHLRLSDPAKSLPYQYQALKLLKEISNDSRIYVHRTGFDAPPLKEEKRLTGELDEVRSSTDKYSSTKKDEFSILSDALTFIEKKINSEQIRLSSDEREVLKQAGEKIAAVALSSPGQHLETLSILQRITNTTEEHVSKSDLKKVIESIAGILPNKPEQVVSRKSALHATDSVFLQNLGRR